ncbi:transposase [Streptomyces sp. NPDC058676]|uniref:transposase n=1 Tax=unclassified Streptomyces TaxID=2593676 RepID=UPI00365EA542
MDDDLWAGVEPLLPPWPKRSPGLRPVDDRPCLQGILYVLLHQDIAWQLLPPHACVDGSHVRAKMGELRPVRLLRQSKRLAVRPGRRVELHDPLLSLACGPICCRRLKKAGS